LRLIDLDPAWIDYKGERVAFVFRCPHCQAIWLSCTLRQMSISDQCEAFIDALREDGDDCVPCEQTCAWKMSGGPDLDSITITPSLDASKSGHWHGHITNGAIA
jgi:hypothetical protein